MNNTNTICPVCTLYLRPGITLKQHLASHPKQKVIDALVRLSGNDGESFKLDDNTPTTTSEPLPSTSSDAVVVNQAWNNNGTSVSNTMQPVQGNHLFIYQQSMSTTAPSTPNVLNINPLTQQYVIPTVFNSQMMPYIYQQQQVIMASNACVPPTGIRALPFEMPSIEGGTIVSEVVEGNENEIKEITEEKEPKDEKLTTTIQIDDVKVNKMPTNEVVIEEIDSDSPEEYQNRSEFVETASSPQNEEITAPKDNWNLELNKDCQTQTTNNEPPVEELDYPEDRPEFYYVENDDGDIQYNNPNILQPVSEQQQQLDMIGMDNMQVLINDLSSNQIISQVDHFENSQPERPGVLMTIGDVVDNEQRQLEDSMSRESSNVNIRTDERMPARGELSGQESIGGSSDITWNRIQYHEGSSGMSASYDLLARESWEASDSSSDMEMPNQIAEGNKEIDETAPSIVSFSGPPLNYKCPSCDEAFSNFKERRDHEIEHHPEKVIRNALIGSGIGKKKVKKLTIKLKTDKSEKPETSENNFDNVFTNKLKLENMKTEQSENQTTPEPVDQVKVDENGMPIELKTVCSICDCVVANIRALKLHKFQVHNITSDIRHKCNTCGEGFRNEFKYTQHLKIHPLECRLCGKLFFRRQNIQLHMKRHLGLKPYKCDLCNKAFVTKQKHDEHRNSHTGESPIKCTLCDETFRRHSNLVQHRNRHHLNIKKNVKDYICFCGEVFHSKKKLAWHKEIHDPKPKSCTQCTEKFVHMSSLTRHMRRAHNEKFLPSENRVTENVQCPICKGTYLRSSLDAHIRNHSGVRPYTCLICNKDFTTKWNLKLHKWTHASRTSKPFKCDQCKGAFIRESDYIAHMNSHKSVRPYTCNYCGAQFIRKYNCLRHVKEHENGKTFNCQVCGKSFHRSYYLKDHMRVHSGIRPYACHICGKTSTTKSNHNKHVQIHHAREPVSTEN